MKKTLDIEGMTCKHCVMHVTTALKELPGVTSVQVDLASKTAVVQGSDLEDSTLTAAVVDAGYQVTAIR
ncbi:MAG: heavy-metal-associated domain-containing protein [Termitinemataceae bacterium]